MMKVRNFNLAVIVVTLEKVKKSKIEYYKVQGKLILAHQSHLEYEGKRLWENQAHHFRDLCKDGANSGTGGKWAILIENEESEKF